MDDPRADAMDRMTDWEEPVEVIKDGKDALSNSLRIRSRPGADAPEDTTSPSVPSSEDA